MNSLSVAFEKARKAKEIEEVRFLDMVEKILRGGLKESIEFTEGYIGKSVNRSVNRTKPIEEAVAKVLVFCGKKGVRIEPKELKVNYNGMMYNKLQAYTSYTSDVRYQSSHYPNLLNVFRAVEIRCGLDSLVKNKNNNTTNLIGRSVIFNDVMSKRSGLSGRNWFSVVGVSDCDKTSQKDLNRIIEEYLVLYEHFPTALILYTINEYGKIIFRHDLIPNVLKLKNFLGVL